MQLRRLAQASRPLRMLRHGDCGNGRMVYEMGFIWELYT
jgi:hypothetical protein